MSLLTTLNLAAGAAIEQPGVYDLPHDVYLADPVKGGSLSSSGARKLLPPSCPALFDYERKHPSTPTREMSFGSAAHKLVLGAGADIVVVDADSWRTNDAKAAKKQAEADGKIPLLAHEYAEAKAMATALRKDEWAAALLDPEAGGKAEQTLVWRDEETGIMCRALIDWLPDPVPGKRFAAPDYKTCPSAAQDKIERSVWDLGYHIQAAWYVAGFRALGLGKDPVLPFIFQERTPPYLVHVVQLDPLAMEAGAHYARQARLIYAECAATGRWPSYSDGITIVELPPWGQNTYFRETGK